MSRACDSGPLPFNYRDVGLSLHDEAFSHPSRRAGCLRAGCLLRCGLIDNASWTALGRPRTIINLRQGADSVAFPGCKMVHLGAANSLEKYDTSDKAVRDWVCSVLKAISTAELPVLVHCRSGRDRTGVIVAAVLCLLGVPEEEVVAEFALSEGAPHQPLTPSQIALLQQTLDPWRTSGGIEAWVRGVDVPLLRAKLLVHDIKPQQEDLTTGTPAHLAGLAIEEEHHYLSTRVQDLWPLINPHSTLDPHLQKQLCLAMLPVFERLSILRPQRPEAPEAGAGRTYAAYGWCCEVLGDLSRALWAYTEADRCSHLDVDENVKVRRFVMRRRRTLENGGLQ
mmetsp:Transcript_10854/g.12772  ORF Transcript_10854/g.12772 Transcript_10854/m.12772 type:complete len:338 (+) Transcript_10854:182-1195(+)|eukprot:CAMPEP_0197843700 /NCGR_PEP_ID=MMETSP1438-20131217/611_1 /TAXON_ID=1461541 /ORGANISM="Pterosperma sp., Strain CCMP1384" /LENGTH=337 /DNA_ID=CAMNT_0043454017 /DNA_START=154 /DNA_END=1167 /DNA_ORIENTATION=+